MGGGGSRASVGGGKGAKTTLAPSRAAIPGMSSSKVRRGLVQCAHSAENPFYMHI